MYRLLTIITILILPLTTFLPLTQAQMIEVNSINKVETLGYQSLADDSLIQQKINLLLQIIELLKKQLAELKANNTIGSSNIESPTNTNSKLVVGRDFAKLNKNETEWEFCSELYFGGCEFEGLHEVRYGQGDNWIIKEYFDGFPGWLCHPNNFGVKGEEGDHCEVSKEPKTGTLDMPIKVMNMNTPSIDLTKIPLGSKGDTKIKIVKTDDRGVSASDGVGAFRIPCRYSHMAFNDPIVYPGQPGASHLHTFFGNTGVNAYSTASSIANTGGSTCPGGIANRSSYWIPTLVDTRDGTPMVPNDSIWYYKTGYAGVKSADIKVLPDGLRMIEGDAKGNAVGDYHWECATESSYYSRSKTIPSCKAGDRLLLNVLFPQCWDGVNLDSADHKSHMSHPKKDGTGCPSTHPVPLPELSLNIFYNVEKDGDSAYWRLSSDNNALPAGSSAHADFFEGWKSSVKTTFVQNCINKTVDCHAFLLGDGTMLSTDY